MSIEINKNTLNGIFLILCGIDTNHADNQYVSHEATILMEKSHKEILNLGKNLGFDIFGNSIKINKIIKSNKNDRKIFNK